MVRSLVDSKLHALMADFLPEEQISTRQGLEPEAHRRAEVEHFDLHGVTAPRLEGSSQG